MTLLLKPGRTLPDHACAASVDAVFSRTSKYREPALSPVYRVLFVRLLVVYSEPVRRVRRSGVELLVEAELCEVGRSARCGVRERAANFAGRHSTHRQEPFFRRYASAPISVVKASMM